MTQALYRKLYTFAAVVFFAGVLQACQNTSKQSATSTQQAVKVRTQLAAAYLREGDVDAAKRVLDVALASHPQDADANMMMGVLLQQEGSPENLVLAERYFQRAIQRDPKHAQARNNYATLLYQQKRYAQAIEQLKLASATLGYDQRYRALENLGRIYLSLDETALAENAFLQALQVNQASTVSMLALAEMFYAQQNFAEATPYLTQYQRLMGQNQSAAALWLGARLARANGDTAKMQQQLDQLQMLFPESQEYQRYIKLQYSTEAVWK